MDIKRKDWLFTISSNGGVHIWCVDVTCERTKEEGTTYIYSFFVIMIDYQS